MKDEIYASLVQYWGRLMDLWTRLCCGYTKASFPPGKWDYWSKFSYNFIFYVDEMHLKGKGSGWRRARALSQALFPPHTDARCDSEAEA